MGNDRLRLLILTPEYFGFGGGVMTFYQTLVTALDRAGLTVRIIVGSALHSMGDCERQSIGRVSVETLERPRVTRWFARFPDYSATPVLRRHLAAAWAMWEQADGGAGFDIVEACDWGMLFVPFVVEATRPTIVQCHGSVGQIAVHDPIAGHGAESLLSRLIERAVIGAASNVQSCSTANSQFWTTETQRRVTAIRPAFVLAPAKTAALSDRGLVIGRLQRWKGPEILCRALTQLGTAAPEIDWVGRDTPWGAPGVSTASHLAAAFPQVWGRTLFHRPPVSPDDVATLQSAALFNLIPSTWDVFNFTVAEAMASGRPTIVSTGAGASELIADGVNGFTFHSADADALANAIDRVLSADPGRIAEIGRVAQATVRDELDPDRVAEQRLAAYRTEIDAFHANPPDPVSGWLGEICRPRAAEAADEMAFLEHQPLRSLAKHVAARVARKVTSR
ncbi:MAG: glycosyltransferase family 4 protein [bacterium]|nr:glycosyltransferase family 4 protein [bacterium]